LSCWAYATDVEGIISGRFDAAAQNASVTVICGDFKKTEYTNMAGNYYIPGVPDNSSCSVTIEWQNLRSKPQEIKTKSGTINFTRRVEPYEGHLHILDSSIN
jgi:hypothetical protein